MKVVCAVGWCVVVMLSTTLASKLEYNLELLPEPPSLEDMSDLLGDYNMETMADLDTYTEAVRTMARLQIAKAFSAEARRYRRGLDTKSVDVTGLNVRAFDFTENPDLSSWINKITGFKLLSQGDKTYFIIGAARTESQLIMVSSSPKYGFELLVKFKLEKTSLESVDLIAAEVDGNMLWLALGSTSSRLVAIFCVHLDSGEIKFAQNIPAKGIVGAIYMFRAGNSVYLVVGESYHSSPEDTAGVSEIYVLVEKYFDRLDVLTMDCTGVRSITGFAERGKYIIILGMDNVKGAHIYQLDPMANSVTFFQELKETNVQQVLHYVDAYDFKHYVIVSSQNRFVKIYWWDHSQLIQWQVLETTSFSTSVALGYTTLSTLETVIYIADGGIITVYTDDVSSHYFKSFSISTGCSSIAEINGIRIDQNYLLYYICIGTVNRLERRILIFHEVELAPLVDDSSNLLKCLTNLNRTLESRKPSIAYLEDVVDNNRLMTTDKSQVWSGPIAFTDLTVTTTATFTQTVNLINVDQDPTSPTSIQSFAELESHVTRLEQEIAALQSSITTGILGSGNQTITGFINASSIIIDNLDIDLLTIKKINEVNLLDLDNTFLSDGSEQIISGRWKIAYLSVSNLDTRSQHPPGLINSFLTSELMRSTIRNQVVTGNHSYSAIIIGEICNSLCNGLSVDINGIDTSTIVIKGSDVLFTDKKIFINIKVNGELNSNTINGLDLQELALRVVYKDVSAKQTLAGQYTLSSLEVQGTLDVPSINGIDFKQLDASVVKTFGNYRITGGLVYETDLVVTGSLTLDSINGILWNDVVDLNSPDLITGMYNFKDATIIGSLASNDINGLDLSSDVVLTNKVQTISGRVQFTHSTEVQGAKGVLMDIRGTVNGVDPSALTFGQQALTKVVVSKDVVFTRPLEVLGDITAVSINGLLLDGIQNRFWSLSRDQVINTPVHLANAIFQGPVRSTTLRGRPLSDYLHTFGSEVITGRYIFQSQVQVEGEVVLDPGRTVDGVDISELRKNLMVIESLQIITGRKTFQGKVTIIGDLDLGGTINGINVTRDLLRLDQSLPHTGRLTFASKTIINMLEIVGGDLTVQTLNGFDLATVVADLVLVDEDAVITGGGGLQFTGQVKVNDLHVSGNVDGVNLHDLQSRALLKNSDKPQVIDGRVLLEGEVSFLGGLTLNKVNGKVWSDYLNDVVQLDYSGSVVGRKVFVLPIDIDGNFNPATINGIDIAHLASRILRRHGEQTIEAVYTFRQNLTTRALFAPVIDGVDMSLILLTDVSGEVSGTVIFEGDVHLLYGLSADHYELDGCNIRNIDDSAILNDNGRVDLLGDVMLDRLIIRGNVKSSGKILAGAFDFKNFLDTVVLKSADQVITAPIQFGEVRIDSLSVKTINNIDIRELFRLSVFMSTDNIVNCDVKYANGLRVRDLVVRLSVSGRSGGSVLVNDISLSEIALRAVHNTVGTVLISGLKTFTNGIIVENLVIAGSLGGVRVSSFVALSRTNILAYGLTFTAPITVTGNLLVTGLVDGVSLQDFLNNRITLNGTQTRFTSCTFENIKVEGNLQIEKINDVVLSDLVIRSETSQVVTGRKVFLGGLSVTGNIQTNLINGINILELDRTIVRRDVATTLNFQVTFSSVVTSSVDIIVNGQVNGFDLSELNAGSLSGILIQQYTRIDEIRGQFGSIREENYRSAQEMFAALSYLERVRYPRDTNVTGSIWVGRIPEAGPGLFLKIATCRGPPGRPCGCQSECYYYKVTDNAQLQPFLQLDYKVDILGHSLSSNLYIAIYSGCFEGVPGAQVRVVSADGSSGFVQRILPGLISDSGLFVADGTSYIVTVNMFVNENDAKETTSINVLTPKLGHKTIAIVWSKNSTRSAVDLDLIWVSSKLYLLVTNSYDAANKIDPYSAKSELYIWNNYNKEFKLKGEYMADHATSGIFISIAAPVQEYFFALAQYKAADFQIYEDNVKYTAHVLIYKFNQFSQEFEPFQYLDVHGVMGQAVLRVDNNYYLLLISAKLNSLYVYQYYHSEGFVLYSALRVKNPQSIAVLEISGNTYVAVSTPDGLERFRVKTKGLDPDNLLLVKR
ncbi:hypothetical protein SK128_002233 [Halocaridina rubra]|uniref:Uncharacterized protein n=1 Tax=Halocaridina rubra TaxID=373956 RepID=A0AAN8XDC8_HALRR